MPITFGSVGDIISICLLIKDLVKLLENSRGSTTEYQAVTQELWSLEHALLQVEQSLRSSKRSPDLDALAQMAVNVAERCAKSVADFSAHLKSYEEDLGVTATSSLSKGVVRKVKWQLVEKERLDKFRSETQAQCMTMNVLLEAFTIALMKSHGEESRMRFDQTDRANAELSAKQDVHFAQTKESIDVNNMLIKGTQSMISQVVTMIDVNLRRGVADILKSVHQLWRTSVLTYNAILTLQDRIPASLDSYWKLKPVTFKDTHGRIFPMPTELINCWEALESVLEVRFRNIDGHQLVMKGQYALRSLRLGKTVGPDVPFESWFLPGNVLIMGWATFVEAGRNTLIEHERHMSEYDIEPVDKGTPSSSYGILRTYAGLYLWPAAQTGEARSELIPQLAKPIWAGDLQQMNFSRTQLSKFGSFGNSLDDFLSSVVYDPYEYDFECLDGIGFDEPQRLSYGKHNRMLTLLWALMETKVP